MGRIGIYTSDSRRRVFEEALGGTWRLDVKIASECGALDALDLWAAAGVPVAVVDDSALDAPADEVRLLEWAGKATAASPRLVMVFDGPRDAEDPFLYQLVSVADVKDLVVTSLGDTLKDTLPARIERPARLMDAAHWKTDDKRKLKRRDGKRRRATPVHLFGKKSAAVRDAGERSKLAIPRNINDEEAGAEREDEGLMRATFTSRDTSDSDVERAVSGEGYGTDDTPANAARQLSAASFLAKPGDFGAAMRKEDGALELASPTARMIIAVGAASRGIGCTHLACALALELAGKGVETSAAVYNKATFEAMRRALAPGSSRVDEFAFGGVTFYTWKAQRAHAEDYDCVVCDCGLVDYPDDDDDSPASLFRRSGYQAMLVSGAPWLLEESSAAIACRDRSSLAATTWFTISAGPLVSANIAAAIAQSAGKKRMEVHPVPYRPDLMCGDTSRYADYSSLLDGVVAAARNVKVSPEEFARRHGGGQ